MKTSELSGAIIDRIVASIETDSLEHFQAVLPDYHPSLDWSQAGPIIENAKIELEYDGFEWWARIKADEEYAGKTPLIAAMRCYVASKLGDEIQILEELEK